MKARLFLISDVRSIPFPRFADETGELSVYQGNSDVPFEIARTYSIRAGEGVSRGDHAHYRCSQVILCVHGACEVICNDAKKERTVLLDSADQGLFIPPTIWSTQTYLEQDTVLFVLCDRTYEKDDYIRDFDAFLSFRTENEP